MLWLAIAIASIVFTTWKLAQQMNAARCYENEWLWLTDAAKKAHGEMVTKSKSISAAATGRVDVSTLLSINETLSANNGCEPPYGHR